MTAEGSTVAILCPGAGTARRGDEGNINHDNIKSRQDGVERFREAAAGMQGRISANVGGSEPLTGGSRGSSTAE
jgi:hypothetical protein